MNETNILLNKDWPVDFTRLPISYLENRIENLIKLEKSLLEIDEAFLNDNKIVAITSTSGMGKSVLANEYAYRFIDKDINNFAYWMNITGETVDEKFKEFAKTLPL